MSKIAAEIRIASSRIVRLIDDLIDVLVWIRRIYPNARAHEIKVMEVTV